MRILLIHNFYQWGGGEDEYVKALNKLLTERGHDVYLYSKDSKTIRTPLDKLNTAIRITNNDKTYRQLNRIIEQFKPEIAQLQNVFPLIGSAAYDICRNKGIPMVQRISNYRFLCPKGTLYRNNAICTMCVNKIFPFPAIRYGCYHQSPAATLLLSTNLYLQKRKALLQSLQAYVFPSAFIRDLFKKELSIPENKLFIIPTFIENTPLQNRIKENFFVYAGRLSEEKGIRFLLKVFATLPHLNLVIIGDGPLRKEAESYKNYGNIKVMGHLSTTNVADYMGRALATIIPSTCYDVLPHTLIESYRQGTPVIAPLLGSFPSLVIQSKTGFLYTPESGADLRKYLLYVHSHKELIASMSPGIRNIFEQQYLPSNHYESLMNIYSSLGNNHAHKN